MGSARRSCRYRLVAIVLNPAVVQDYEGTWNLQTFSEDEPSFEAGLDEVIMQGFRVNRVMALWQYRHLDEHGHPQARLSKECVGHARK